MTVKTQQIRQFFFECDQCGATSKPHHDIQIAAAFATAQGFTVPDVTAGKNWIIEPIVCRKCAGDDVTARRRANGLKHDLGLSDADEMDMVAFWHIAACTVVGTGNPRTVYEVMGLRYDRRGDRVHTVAKVAQLLQVTQPRATQIITQCLRAMREHVSEYTQPKEQEND